MRTWRLALLVLGLAACGSSDAILVGPRFRVPGDARDIVAIRVDDTGHIVSLHTSYPSDGRLVDVPGRVAYPGLGDAHVHLSWLARRDDVLDLGGLTSVAAVRQALEVHAAKHPEPRVVTGDAWDQTLWSPAEMPRADDLGDVVTRPVVLTRVDGHVVWLNHVALRGVADYLAHDHAPPEHILRDADGHASGVVVDPRPELLQRLVPEPATAELARWLELGMTRCADAGLVEVHDMAVSPAELAALVARAQEPLPLRVVVYSDSSEPSFAWLAQHGPGPVVIGDLEVRGVKLFADGALGSRGAALKAPYADDPGNSGQATPPSELVTAATRAAKLGFDVAIHAIGDQGVANALSALEAARAVATRPFVGRVEHAQVIDLAHDLARFVAGGFVASMQPTHATSDARWAEARLGARVVGAYAWRTLLDAGVALAFGSDAPVESFDPRRAIWAATRREPWEGATQGWHMEQAVSFDEAVTALSDGLARATHSEGERGRLAPGQLLQLTVFDRELAPDPRAAHAVATVRGLRIRKVSAK